MEACTVVPAAPAAFVQAAAYTALVEVPAAQMSVLVLADRLLTLAQQADGAGLTGTADRLVRLAHDVFDEQAGTEY